MATTGSNFVYTTGSNPVLIGTAVSALPALGALGPKEAMAVSQQDQVVGGSGAPNASASTVVDRLVVDPGLTAVPNPGTPPAVPEVYGTVVVGGAKNGSVLLNLAGTTAQTINWTNTATNAPAATAGDTQFATAYGLIVKNLGTTAVVMSPGASNPSPIPQLGGTSPTVTIPAGSQHFYHAPAGVSITGSACNLTFTPAAGGTIVATLMGA